MNYISNDCFHLSSSQGMSDLRATGGNYDTMLIESSLLRSWPSAATLRVICMPPDGVLYLSFRSMLIKEIV